LDNIPAECERESRKERKEADARAINKTSGPQIFAVHAKKRTAHTRRVICLVSHSSVGRQTVDKISNNKKHNNAPWFDHIGGNKRARAISNNRKTALLA
jgi:hypothetical protein